MKVIDNYVSNKLSYLRLESRVHKYAECKDYDEVQKAVELSIKEKLNLVILGKGSNTVFVSSSRKSLVVKLIFDRINVIDTTSVDDSKILIEVDAGRDWDEFVHFCVEQEFWGIENMSLIPGTVGALPIQNVGAYGQDASQVLKEVRVYDTSENKFTRLSKRDCKFTWRESIFNTSEKGRYIILSVVFELSRERIYNLSRKDLKARVQKNCNDLGDISLKSIRSAVIELRSSGILLPIGEREYNCGTFFRASRVSKNHYWKLFFKVLFTYNLEIALRLTGYRIKYGKGKHFIVPAALFLNAEKNTVSDSGNFWLFTKNKAVLIHNGRGEINELVEFVSHMKARILRKTGIEIVVEPTFIEI